MTTRLNPITTPRFEARAEKAREHAQAELRATRKSLASARAARKAELHKLALLKRRRDRTRHALRRSQRSARKQLTTWRARKEALDQRARRLARLAKRYSRGQTAKFAAGQSATPPARREAKAATARVRNVSFVDGRRDARVVVRLDGAVSHRILSGSKGAELLLSVRQACGIKVGGDDLLDGRQSSSILVQQYQR